MRNDNMLAGTYSCSGSNKTPRESSGSCPPERKLDTRKLAWKVQRTSLRAL